MSEFTEEIPGQIAAILNKLGRRTVHIYVDLPLAAGRCV
jgi:hypothetical protein